MTLLLQVEKINYTAFGSLSAYQDEGVELLKVEIRGIIGPSKNVFTNPKRNDNNFYIEGFLGCILPPKALLKGIFPIFSICI